MNKTNCQRTALESAARNGHDKCVQMLIQTGMHEKIYYKYAFNKAMAFKHENITGMLVEALGYENIPEDYLMKALLHGTEGGQSVLCRSPKGTSRRGSRSSGAQRFPQISEDYNEGRSRCECALSRDDGSDTGSIATPPIFLPWDITSGRS